MCYPPKGSLLEKAQIYSILFRIWHLKNIYFLPQVLRELPILFFGFTLKGKIKHSRVLFTRCVLKVVAYLSDKGQEKSHSYERIERA